MCLHSARLERCPERKEGVTNNSGQKRKFSFHNETGIFCGGCGQEVHFSPRRAASFSFKAPSKAEEEEEAWFLGFCVVVERSGRSKKQYFHVQCYKNEGERYVDCSSLNGLSDGDVVKLCEKVGFVWNNNNTTQTEREKKRGA